MRHLPLLAALGALSPLGCITVNINFPAKQVERAAEVIVEEARTGDTAGTGETSSPSPEGGKTPGERAAPGAQQPPHETETAPPVKEAQGPRGGGRTILVSFQEKKDDLPDDIRINIDTPVIKGIRAMLARRFPRLLPFYEKGAIGENREGYLEIRDDKGLTLAGKRDLKALVEEENRDRKNLYTEIVKANKFPEERLKDVGRIFAVQWIGKSRTGWWVQNEKGEWEKKKPPGKKEKEGGKSKA